jgi:hypothetical protein
MKRKTVVVFYISCVGFILHKTATSSEVQSLAAHRLKTTDLDGRLEKETFGIVSDKSTDNITGYLLITYRYVEFHI